MVNESNDLSVYRIFQNMEKELNKVLAVVGKYLSMTIWRKSPYFSRGMDSPK